MPRHLISLPAALLAALLPLTALAQSPAEPLELAAAERILLDANPAIQQARAAQAAARAGIDMAGARPNPVLTASVPSTTPARNNGGAWDRPMDSVLRVDQLFERGDKRALRLAAAERNLSASGADLANTIRLARIELARAWLDLRAAQDIRRIDVSNIQERLNLYTELDKLVAEEDIQKFGDMLKDRFGKLPSQINELFVGLRLRTIAKKLGFERIILKNRKMNCYFVTNPQSIYYETPVFLGIMKYVSSEGHFKGFAMKQSNNYLILTKENVKTLKEARGLLDGILEHVMEN